MTDASTAPRNVQTARVLMYVQGALGVIATIVAIATADNDAGSGQRGGRALFGLIGIGLIVGLFVLATRLKDLRSSTRSWALGVETALAVVAVLGLRRNPFGSIVSLVFAVVVIVMLVGAHASFTADARGRGSKRLDPRDVPDLPQ